MRRKRNSRNKMKENETKWKKVKRNKMKQIRNIEKYSFLLLNPPF